MVGTPSRISSRQIAVHKKLFSLLFLFFLSVILETAKILGFWMDHCSGVLLIKSLSTVFNLPRGKSRILSLCPPLLTRTSTSEEVLEMWMEELTSLLEVLKDFSIRPSLPMGASLFFQFFFFSRFDKSLESFSFPLYSSMEILGPLKGTWIGDFLH